MLFDIFIDIYKALVKIPGRETAKLRNESEIEQEHKKRITPSVNLQGKSTRVL